MAPRIPGDNRGSLSLAEGFPASGTATLGQAFGSSVAQDSLTSYRRVGPEVRGTWSRYADQRLAEASDPNTNRVARRTTASTCEHTRPSSPVNGWATSILHQSGAEKEMDIPYGTSASASERKSSDMTASKRQPEQPLDRPRSSRTTVQQSVEHNSPPSITALPHEHFRSPTQSEPGRGSPYPYFHDTGGHQDTTGSSSNAIAVQHEAEAHLPMSEPVGHAPPLGQHSPTMPEPSPATQQQGIVDSTGSGIVTEKLIDLAYKITEGMSFKEPPSTPRRPDLAA